MYNKETKSFGDAFLCNDILIYNPYRQGVLFNIPELFKKCFPGVDLKNLDFPTATLLVQKELIKASRDLYTVKDIDELHFKANKAAWIFNVLFEDNIVLDWFFPMEYPLQNAPQEGSLEYPKLNATDFSNTFFWSRADDIRSNFEMVIRYLILGDLGRHTQGHGQMRRNLTLCESNNTPTPDFVERHPECARSVHASPPFMRGYSGRDNSTSSLLFGVKEEAPHFSNRGDPQKSFKSCISPGEEHMARHPENGGFCREIPVSEGNCDRKERAPSSLLDCFKELHRTGARLVDDKHLSSSEFENLLDQVILMQCKSLIHFTGKEDEGNVKQDKLEEKPSYGIQFYVCHPYKGKYSK